MILNRRERYIAIGAAVALGALVVNQFALTPLLARQEILRSDVRAADDQLKDKLKQIEIGKRSEQVWSDMQAKGLKDVKEAAEYQLLTTLDSWRKESGLPQPSVNPERTESDKHFFRMTYLVTVSGSMSSIGKFLSKVEKASIPVRITDIQVGSRQEGGSKDDLSLMMRLSTLVVNPEGDKKPTGSAKEGR